MKSSTSFGLPRMSTTARGKLMKRFKLTELQATAILDLQLRRLAALERKKIETEYREVTGDDQGIGSIVEITEENARRGVGRTVESEGTIR